MKYPIKPLGKFLYYTGTVKLYHIGKLGTEGMAEGVFCKWHPLTWLTWAAMVVPCAVVGERISDVVKTSVSDFYKENTQWLTWKDIK